MIGGTHHTDNGRAEASGCREAGECSNVDEIELDDGDWAIVVAKVPLLKEEVIFRTIVGYL